MMDARYDRCSVRECHSSDQVLRNVNQGGFTDRGAQQPPAAADDMLGRKRSAIAVTVIPELDAIENTLGAAQILLR
jgi:hypothetical protein